MPPPTHNAIISQQNQGKALLLFLREEGKLSNRQAKGLLDRRSVFVNGKRVWIAKHTLRRGDQIEWPALPAEDKSKPADILILYKDPYLIAVNKPAGLVSDRDKESVETALREQERSTGIRALHRLDKETSGLLMFLRSSEHRGAYLDLFRRQEIHKTYQALLVGHLNKNDSVVRKALDGKSAETRFRVIKQKGNFCKVECSIATGRFHQIRRHAVELGCRVAGDRQHAQQLLPYSPIEKSLPRQMLHASSVTFTCPIQKKEIRINAPFTADFQRASKQMGLE